MSSRPQSDIARLEQLLAEANERAEQERRRAEQERRRAEQERRRAEDAEKKAKPTTFEEYLHACHSLLSRPLHTQTDKSLSTQGSSTSTRGKAYPNLLKPWTDFPILQQELFERVSSYIPPDAEHFSSTQYLKELGQDICDRPLASEKDLETYQRLAIERPTTNIINYLLRIEEARRQLNLDGGIIFENHANTLSDSNEEVQHSLQNLHITAREQASNLKPRNADQICVYKAADGTRRLCMIVEYKPSHKLSVFNLRAGLLRADNGIMDIVEDVINGIKIPTDPAEKFVYHSERLVAAALTQTYSYMIENGLEFSKLVTGDADVFLQVKEDEPQSLYYHLAEPTIEAEAHNEVDILLCRTAISQTLTFCLMALDSKPRSQQWRNDALKTARRTVIDHEAILRQIPAEERALTPPSSVFHARIHPFRRSPIRLRPRKPNARNSCGSADTSVYEDPQSPSGSSDEFSDVETPSKGRTHEASASGIPTRSSKSSQVVDGSDVRHRPYCTQACLLGLVRGSVLDDGCPNIHAHRACSGNNHHALRRDSLRESIVRQLAVDPDNGCEPLGRQGACGALFKLTLELYGYTFVGKGTVTAFKAKLKHEGMVYRYLDAVQGELIPVYLGNISLTDPYFLDFGVRIVHLLLLSWAGEQARTDVMLTMGRDLATDTSKAVAKALEYGVQHCDIRPANVLWNPEIRKIMLIDFERSEILKQMAVLQETSPNRKRKCLHLEPSCQIISAGIVTPLRKYIPQRQLIDLDSS